jgi:8-oxo-dGTP pyrophosphatase MutT (NUDIX family)
MFAWLARFIERHPRLHGFALRIWRWLPPRLAGFLKGLLARKWLVGAVAVMIDDRTSPAEVLLVEHSYRPKGAWGLPGGSLESTPGDPTKPRDDASSDDVIESALRREIFEELGIEITVMGLLRIDAIPYIPEEPGPYRLDFYFRCAPRDGFAAFRRGLRSGRARPSSPEIRQMRLVPLTDLGEYDLFSSDARFLAQDLPRRGLHSVADAIAPPASVVVDHYLGGADARGNGPLDGTTAGQAGRQGPRRAVSRGRSNSG